MTCRHAQGRILILALCLAIMIFVIGVSPISGQGLPATILTIIVAPLMMLFSSLTGRSGHASVPMRLISLAQTRDQRGLAEALRSRGARSSARA